MIRPSTPSDFQHCSSTEFPAASTISRWKAMSCWTSAFVSPASHGVAHRLELDLERRDVALEVLRREPGRELLERRAHRVDLDHLLLVEHANARAAERLRLDESQQLEVAQRLAHGRLARAELLRDPRLDEPLARLRARRSTIRCSSTSLTCSRRTVREIAATVGPWNGRTRRRMHERDLDQPAIDRIGDLADAVDLDRDGVARLQQPLRVAEDADPGGRAGQDQVAGLERRRARGVADDLVDPEDQVRRRRVLQRLAGDDGADPRARADRAPRRPGTSGPTGQNVSGDLPRVHWPSANWRSRAETSFATT